MSTHWSIRYRGEATHKLRGDSIAALYEYLKEAEESLPGLQTGPPGESSALFTGALELSAGGSSREVMALLDGLNALQERFDDLRILVVDSLRLLERDETGRFRISMDSDDEDPWDEAQEEDDEEDLLGLDEDLLDFAPSLVFEGIDPAFLPFDDLGAPVPLGEVELLESMVTQKARSWTPNSLQISRRQAIDGGGYVYELRGEIQLEGAEIAHIVELDLALLGSAGEVLASEAVTVAHDVHRQTEIFASITIDASLAARTAQAVLAIDAYYRHDVDVAHWSSGGQISIQTPDELPLECTFRRVVWPYPALQVSGRFANEMDSYLACVELTLDVFDDEGELLSDDDGDFGMTGPREERTFRLQAPLDEEDEPASGVLRARLAPRRRETLCTIALARSTS